MKKLKYIYLLLIAMLLGFAISSCEDDDVVVGEEDDEEIVGGGSGEMISTTFTVGISAPNVSGDLDVATRAGGDNANIEYANLENGGRFQNIVVVLVGPVMEGGDDNLKTGDLGQQRIYGVHCKDWGDGVGVKEYNVIFPGIDIPKSDVTKSKQYTVYAFGNVCKEFYDKVCKDTVSRKYNIADNRHLSKWTNFQNFCLNMSIKADDVYNVSFKPNSTNYYSTSNVKEYYINKTSTTGYSPYICTGMPVNNSATATVVKGNTQFNVALKRVCARLQVTFRNFTGKTDYDHYYDLEATGNRVYVDNFVLKKALVTSTNYFYNGSAPTTVGSVDFDILKALGGTNDHKINKIENGADLVVSMYVFENKKNTSRGTDAYTYDLKVDRGKSLGQQVSELQNDNVYVMWSDNLDKGSNYENSVNRCLGADDNNVKLVQMDNPNDIPYGTGDYGNRVFWQYNGGKFRSCKVDLKTDECTLTTKYLKESSLSNSGTSYNPSYKPFEGFNRFRLKDNGTLTQYLMLSNNKLQNRIFLSFEDKKPYYPWVFFAKYIIKNGETFSTGTGTSKTAITKIDRNHSYELDFSVMPNYDTKQEILVNCVRKQNEVNWSEVEK